MICYTYDGLWWLMFYDIMLGMGLAFVIFIVIKIMLMYLKEKKEDKENEINHPN